MVNRLFGYTLIEILVSLLLLSILMLGLNTIQAVSLRSARAADYVGIAEMQLYSMAERLTLLTDSAVNDQISLWNEQNSRELPNGHGVVSGHFPAYHVAIYWGKATQPCDQLLQGLSGCLTLAVNVTAVSP